MFYFKIYKNYTCERVLKTPLFGFINQLNLIGKSNGPIY